MYNFYSMRRSREEVLTSDFPATNAASEPAPVSVSSTTLMPFPHGGNDSLDFVESSYRIAIESAPANPSHWAAARPKPDAANRSPRLMR
jgi:hypothetical protein